MIDNDTQQHLKQMGMIQGLDADKQLEAGRIIDMGADISLIYFWYNLGKAYFYPNFSLDEVHQQVVYYKDKYPSMKKEITEWVRGYEARISEIAADNAEVL